MPLVPVTASNFERGYSRARAAKNKRRVVGDFLARRAHRRRRNAGARRDRAKPREARFVPLFPIVDFPFDSGIAVESRFEFGQQRRLCAVVDDERRRARAREMTRERKPAFAHADDERARHRIFSADKPTRTKIIVTIQKRTTT